VGRADHLEWRPASATISVKQEGDDEHDNDQTDWADTPASSDAPVQASAPAEQEQQHYQND
jgi:hypothetical protein